MDTKEKVICKPETKEYQAGYNAGYMDAQRETDMYKHVRHGDCSRCSRTYGTLGCCSTVSNKWYYSCKEGMKEYTDSAISKTWEMAKKITSLSPFMLDRLFEASEPAEVFLKYTWEEVADILSKYIEEEGTKKKADVSPAG